MKKKVLLSVVSLMAMFGMASCGGNSGSVTPSSQTPTSDTSDSHASASEAVTLTSLAISNKNAFAGLHALDANVKLELAISPAGNVASLVNSGVISITSSNTAVGVVNGLYFSPVGAGETTITVTSGSLSDTVTVTVAESLAEPAFVKNKTLHEIWTMDNDAGAQAYVVTGTIKSMKSGSEAYGSFYLDSGVAEDGDIFVYGSSAKASAMVYSLADKAYKFTNPKDFNTEDASKGIKDGDKVTMLAIRADYNTTKEIVGIILAVDDAPVSNGAMTTDEVQAVKNDKTFAYTVTGKITKWASGSDGSQYGNFSIKSEGATGNELVVYGASATDTALAFTDGANAFTNPKDFLTNAGTKDLKVGDEISMLAIRCDYQETVEIQGIILKAGDASANPATALAVTCPSVIYQGESAKAVLTVTPADAVDSYEWTSSSSKVTVADGVITVAADATIDEVVTITVASKANPTVTATCSFTVAKGLTDAEKYGTADAPLTVAAALATLKRSIPTANDTLETKIYVTGIANSVATKSVTSGTSYTVTLVDALTDTESLMVYSGNLGSGVSAPMVNDVVVANGYSKNYSGTLEICGVNSVFPEYTSVVRGTSKITVDAPEGVTVTGLGETATNGSTASFTVAVPEGKKVDTVKNGTDVLTAADDGSYSFTVSGDAAIKITIKDADAPEEVVLYSTGFESSEGFTPASSYNNASEKLFGASDKQWGTLCGTPATGTPIAGSQSMQLRNYDSVTSVTNPVCYMNFDVAGVSKVSFDYKNKSASDKFKVMYSADSGATWIDIEEVDGSQNVASYEHTFEAPVESFRLKLEFSVHAVNKSEFRVDNVVLK